MKKFFTFLLVFLCTGIYQAKADVTASYDNVTAKWDFKNDLPAGIRDLTKFEGKTGTLTSTVDTIQMTVDATSGKLNSVGRNNAQCNAGTKLLIPVTSTKDTVTIVGYGGVYSSAFTINGTEYTDDEIVYVAKSADVTKGYVEAVCSGGGYLNSISVVHVSKFQEKPLYETDFTDWSDYDRKTTTDEVVTKSTKYSHETLSFTLNGVGVDNDGTNAKFSAYTGYMIFAKYTDEYSAAEPSCVTSALANVTKVVFTQAATGGTRGVKVSVKGDGDADWVTLFNQSIATSSGETQTIEVNRTNCQIKFENFTLNQNGYIVDLKIYGYVDMSQTPALGEITLNGSTYVAADYCTENADGNYAGTIEISKTQAMASASNPVSLTADNGEIGDVTYTAQSDNATLVTIPVTANGTTIKYLVTFAFKPDYTLTYVAQDGTTVGTQTVEKDAAIGTFAYGESNLTIADGYKFRGWAESSEDNNPKKYTESYVVDGDMTLYALVTDIETANDTARYEYKLSSQNFCADDHEGFTLIGSGKYYNDHGWVISSGDKIELLCGGSGYIKLGLCRYGNDCTITLTDPNGNTVGTATAPVETDGAETSIMFEGLPSGTYTLSFDGGTYLHSVTVVNLTQSPYTASGDWYILKAGDADGLVTTLELVTGANSSSSSSRKYIFLPNGTYDLGNKCLTGISGYNISLIGQSTDGVTIKNLPLTEGIGATATLLNTSSDLYMQDLTLQNAWDYNGATGRAVCLQDRGSQTIGKNVRMLSYQDTYYSNNSSDTYWETCEFHGVVDYLCGGGDVYYNKCTLVNENVGNKSATMTAPYPGSNDKWGYVFDSCTVESPVKFNWGRSWGGYSKLIYLNTVLNQPENIVDTRFTTDGMNTAASCFKEYNTLNTSGAVVSPTSNILTFTLYGKDVYTYETILSASEAAAYTYDKIFSEGWDPKSLCVQADSTTLTLENNKLSWKSVDGAIAYAVFGDDAIIGIVTDGTSLEVDGKAKVYTVRSANSMGGLGLAAKAVNLTGIDEVSAENAEVTATEYYDIAGAKVNGAQHGVVIRVQTLKNGQKIATKVVK